jgi:hypothetical protein
MLTKEQALKLASEYATQIKNMFPWADVSTDSIEGRSFYVFHHPENSWNSIRYNYSFDTPLNSEVNISISRDTSDTTARVHCTYRKYDANKEMSINGKNINGVYVGDAPISEQLANIRLLLAKRKV